MTGQRPQHGVHSGGRSGDSKDAPRAMRPELAATVAQTGAAVTRSNPAYAGDAAAAACSTDCLVSRLGAGRYCEVGGCWFTRATAAAVVDGGCGNGTCGRWNDGAPATELRRC